MINFIFPDAGKHEVARLAEELVDKLLEHGEDFEIYEGDRQYPNLIAVAEGAVFFDAAYEDGPVYEIINGEMRYLHDH